MEKRKDILEQAALDLFSITPQMHRALRQRLVRTTLADMSAGITPHQIEIVKLLDDEEMLPIGEIGAKLQISRAQMTHHIDNLVELSLIERKESKKDRRIIYVTLTDHGKDLLKVHKEKMKNAVRDMMSALPDRELDDLSDSLRQILEILSKII